MEEIDSVHREKYTIEYRLYMGYIKEYKKCLCIKNNHVLCMYYIIVYISTQLIMSRRRRIKYVWMTKYISNSKYRDENHHDTHYI